MKPQKTKMRVTIIEAPDAFPDSFFTSLLSHLQQEKSELLVLNELPLSPWIACFKEKNETLFQQSIADHKKHSATLVQFFDKVPSLQTILYSNPTSEHFNEACALVRNNSVPIGFHKKRYLPDEADTYEVAWYERGPDHFEPIVVHDQASVGALLCSELWFTDKARRYGKHKQHPADIIICPRATEVASAEKWIIVGKAVAMISGTFVLSSNRVGKSVLCDTCEFGGTGFVISPDGTLLAKTSQEQPFVTVEIDLQLAKNSKSTYPRYIQE